MKLLAIETSCDETAVSILECTGEANSASFRVLGNALISQIDIHREFGGVFPAVAKREHAKNLVPLLEAALEEAGLLVENKQALDGGLQSEVSTLLEREPELDQAFFALLSEIETPNIDAIAVTAGPGLEPALWVGINFAKALSLIWNKPLIAVNHMEGHLISALAEGGNGSFTITDISFPVLALLISGGHTELLLMKKWGVYERIGETRDDAAGEAYDKVARMLNLPYPGGPEISQLAEHTRHTHADEMSANTPTLPRPMLHDPNCDFSFSGLKTAVLYHLKAHPELSEIERGELAREFEDAVCEVLLAKTCRAIEETNAGTLVLGGGVSVNTNIQRNFQKAFGGSQGGVQLRLPKSELTTDNAIMIGMAGYHKALREEYADREGLRAEGNQHLG
ncbi:MAG: tRNA (adenosine(37)-N6)-threonylcarbamoyltransferase complex transferase subunit TsaD [Patescibacteria group bacterium]